MGLNYLGLWVYFRWQIPSITENNKIKWLVKEMLKFSPPPKKSDFLFWTVEFTEDFWNCHCQRLWITLLYGYINNFLYQFLETLDVRHTFPCRRSNLQRLQYHQAKGLRISFWWFQVKKKLRTASSCTLTERITLVAFTFRRMSCSPLANRIAFFWSYEWSAQLLLSNSHKFYFRKYKIQCLLDRRKRRVEIRSPWFSWQPFPLNQWVRLSTLMFLLEG